MKKLLVIGFVFLAPLLASAMGSRFPSPFPTGIQANCKHTYEGGFGPETYDTMCLSLAKSTPIEVKADCHYDDYVQTEKYKDPIVRSNTEQSAKAARKAAFEFIKYGLTDVQKLQSYHINNYYNQPTGRLEQELMAGKYCQRAIPTNTQNAFAANVDVPASNISLWTEDYISSLWAQDLPKLRAKHPESDFTTLVELNLKGARIWNKMLECSNNNPELARQQYFNASFQCDSGKELKQEIKHYVESVKFFFSTSFMQAMEIKIKTNFELMQAIHNKEGIHQVNIANFPTFHPLFAQAFQQILVEIFPAGSRDTANVAFIEHKLGLTKDRQDSLLLRSISQMDDFRPDGIVPYGLWPSANYAIQVSIEQSRFRVLQSHLDGKMTITKFKGMAFGAFQRLPDFYDNNSATLVDEMRAMNKRYGL